LRRSRRTPGRRACRPQINPRLTIHPRHSRKCNTTTASQSRPADMANSVQVQIRWWCLDQGGSAAIYHPSIQHPTPPNPIPKNKKTKVCIPGNRQRRAGGYLQLRAAPRRGRPIRSPRPSLCHRDGGTPTPSFPSPFCGTHTGCPFWGRPRFGLFPVCLSGGRRVCPNSVTVLLLLGVSPPRKWWWASCSFFFSPRGAAVVHARVGIFAQHTHPIHSFIPPFSTDLGLGKR